MTANELIDRYVHAVGQQLPKKMRGDIEQELRSLLQDALDEQTPPGEEPTIEAAEAIVRQFGKPEEMAANYRPKQVLIGEALFPTYKTVLTIVLTVMTGFHLVLLLIMLFANGTDNWFSALSGLSRSLFEMGFFAAGSITVAFAVMERVDGVSAEVERNSAEWNPHSLPPVKDPDRIDKADLIASIVFGFAFIVALNFFFDTFGVINVNGEDYGFVDLFTNEFRRLIPWLTASWSIEVLLQLVVLLQGRWTRQTRWLRLAVQLIALCVLYLIFSSSVWIVPIANTITKGVFAFIMIAHAIEIAHNLYRLLAGFRSATSATFQSNPV